MKNIAETVVLPDPERQPLVHPIDLPEARGDFRKAWIINSLANPAVCLCLAAILWFVSEDWLPPFFLFAGTLGFGWMASRWSLREAWEYIPRKRQDRARVLPLVWPLGSSLILAVVLTAATVLLGFRMSRSDVPLEVREVAFGAAITVCVLAIIVVGFELVRRSRPARDVLLGLIPLAAVIIGVAVGSRAMFTEPGVESWLNVSIGALIMLVGGLCAATLKWLDLRHDARKTISA